MGKIAAVAINTFREAVRDRVLYGLVGVALFVLFLTLALAELSLHQERRIVLDIGLASISLFSVVVSVFLGSSLLYKEIERKTLYVVLPKPVERYQFLLGKYLGITLTAGVFIAIMGAVQLWLTAVQAGVAKTFTLTALGGLPALLLLCVWRARDRTAVVVPWSLFTLAVCTAIAMKADVPLFPLLSALALVVGEVLVVTAVALLFSAFSTPFLTALFTAGLWLVGRSADSMATMKSKVLSTSIKDALKALVHIIPNFNLFVPGQHTLENQIDGSAGPLAYVLTSLGYAVVYSTLLVALAAFIFRRRDLL
ncbi:MAG: ABC transporter permease subunit [Deltaproteobacteria bacterium]|nr:ABC transporter permease subunit [Deltaproteobacteria bacterium]